MCGEGLRLGFSRVVRVRDRVRVSYSVRISRIMYVVRVLGLDVCGEGPRVRRVW